MTEIKAFFKALSTRRRHENDLSDLTYAFCEANMAFRQFFLDFFFGENTLNAREVEIEREVPYGDENSRPDFVISTKGDEIYLVENKIGDRNHHFEQYREILKKNGSAKIKNHLGYIANYEINWSDLSEGDKNAYNEEFGEDYGRSLKTWQGFFDALQQAKIGGELLQGYLALLQNVCGVNDFIANPNEPVLSEDFKAVNALIQSLDNAIKTLKPKYNLDVWETSKCCMSECAAGRYFELKEYSDGSSVYGWIGTIYTNDGGVICVEFENGYGKIVRDDLRFKDKLDGEESDLLVFLTDATDFSTDTITAFLNEVLRVVKDGGDVNSLCYSQDKASRFPCLLCLKSFPSLLERYCFFTPQEIQDNKCYLVREEAPDQEDIIGGWLGRHFVVRKTGDEQTDVLDFYITAEFRNLGERHYRDEPKIVIEIKEEMIQEACSPRGEWHPIGEGWLAFDLPMNERFCDSIKKIKEVILKIVRNRNKN